MYVLGFNHIGIPVAYAMGYGLASFTTLATILGRYSYDSGSKIDGCCSVLDQDNSKGFLSNLITTLRNFGLWLEENEGAAKAAKPEGDSKVNAYDPDYCGNCLYSYG